MSEYRIFLTQTASLSIDVEAENLEAAIDAAYDEAPSGVCAQCSGWGHKWSLELGGEWQTDEESLAADYPDE